MNHRQQSRSSSHGRKALPQHARPAKPPALTRKGHSYSQAHSHPSPSHDASGRPGAGWSKKVGVEHDEDDVDMESFLQFCATCERQIITPGASILYCSESCRRKDSQSQPTCDAASKHSPLLASSMSYLDHHHIDEHIPDIVPQRSPTVLRPLSRTFSDLMISESGSPTDTTPYDLTTTPARHHHHHHHHHHHDPCHWADISSSAVSGRTRPQSQRRSTNLDLSALPSLIHSPSSSLGSPTSTRPTAHTPASPTSRPASHQPAEAGAGSLKSTASTLTSFRVVEADSHAVAYEKRRPATGPRTTSDAQGSLQQLFSLAAKA